MPALAAEWGGSNHSSMGSYSDQNAQNKYKIFNSDDGTQKKSSSNGLTERYSFVNAKVAHHVPSIGDGIPAPKRTLYDGSNLQLHWISRHKVGVGFENLSNTCFLNSVLQCLCYTPPLTQYLSTNHHKKQCKMSEFCMMCSLSDLMEKSFSSPYHSLKPLDILHNLRYIAKCLTWGQQEDAHEFLRYVVDAMQKSCLYGMTGLDEYSKGTSVVHQIFGGYLRSQVKCDKCSYASNTYDPLLDISVDLRNSDSVEQALKKFVSPESLDIENAYKCERCQVKVTAQKRFTIHRPSNILTIHLKRFDMNRMLGAKVSRHISFSQNINIRPYMSCSQGEPINYALYGVLVHSGYSCNSGHYYSYIKAADSNWYCMNDSSVSQTSLSEVLNADAYLLFYVRSNVKPRVNGVLPHTITKSDLMNGSGDHLHSKRIIGPELPPSAVFKRAKPVNSFTLNSLAVNGNSTGKLVPASTVLKSSAATNSSMSNAVKRLVPYLDDDGTKQESGQPQNGVDDNGAGAKAGSTKVTEKNEKPIGKLSLQEYTARRECKTVNDLRHDEVNHKVVNDQLNGTKPMMFTPRAIKVSSKNVPISVTHKPAPDSLCQLNGSNDAEKSQSESDTWNQSECVNKLTETVITNNHNGKEDFQTGHFSNEFVNGNGSDTSHTAEAGKSNSVSTSCETKPSNSTCSQQSSTISYTKQHNSSPTHSKSYSHRNNSPYQYSRSPQKSRHSRQHSRSPRRRSRSLEKSCSSRYYHRDSSRQRSHRRSRSRSRSPRKRQSTERNGYKYKSQRSRSSSLDSDHGGYKQRQMHSRYKHTYSSRRKPVNRYRFGYSSRNHSPKHQSSRSRSPKHQTSRSRSPRHRSSRHQSPKCRSRSRSPRHQSSRHQSPRYRLSRHQSSRSQSPICNGKVANGHSDYKDNRSKSQNGKNGKRYKSDDDKRPLLNGDSGDDDYQWVEVTKQTLNVKKDNSSGKNLKSKTVWYDEDVCNEVYNKNHGYKESDKQKSLKRLTQFAAKVLNHGRVEKA